MAGYLDGLRNMFGLGTGSQSLRGKQLQQQEDAILQPQLRQAPVQPQVAASPVLTPQQQDELERQERQKRLDAVLEAIRSGQQ